MSETPIESLAAVLRGRQADLVRPMGKGLDLAQVGAAVLSGEFSVPHSGPSDPVVPRGGEATIETFVGDRGGGLAAAMGGDDDVAAWWQDTVDRLVGRVLEALGPLGVQLGGPIYVTTSATPIDQVIAEAHLDDDQFDPEAGVGVVAIAASHDGPRLARGALACPRAMANGPLGLDQSDLDRWFETDEGAGGMSHRVQGTGSDRVVLFPRFGQLHAGPPLAANAADRGDGDGDGGDAGDGVRSLLVLRADTIPAA